MSRATCPIYLIDDDPAVLKGMTRLLRAAGFDVVAFSSAKDFLVKRDAAVPGCLILDVAMPGLTGLELQDWLAHSGSSWPIIFVSGRSDIPISVEAMKAGAVDFLTKPVDEQKLLDAIQVAIERETEKRAREAESAAIRARWATLTEREQQVLEHVVSGQLNKQAASELGIVEKTIKVHRARGMQKMGARSLAELVRMAERIGIGPPKTAGGGSAQQNERCAGTRRSDESWPT